MTGTLTFYLLWPLIWFYAPLRVRVRVVLQSENEILVVKNWFGPGSWQLPGGGMKFGETVSLTACREITEELGLVISEKKLTLLTTEPKIVKQHGLLLRYHYVQVLLPKKPTIKASREITAHEWLDRKHPAVMKLLPLK